MTTQPNTQGLGSVKEILDFTPKPPYLTPTDEKPDEETLYEWMDEGGCEATDGCWVEPDGYCTHGHVSWLIYMGVM